MASQGAQVGTRKAYNSKGQTGEASVQFPILCETCLGPNEYLRMIRCEHSKECNVCARPMTVFRWKPGRDSRYKNSIICQTCAKVKNVCQCCLYDLEYGLPVAVRDNYSKPDDFQKHSSDVQRNYFAARNEEAMSEGLAPHLAGDSRDRTNEDLKRLARKTVNYSRNRPQVCSFYTRGECNRGKECPYRHEDQPDNADMAKQKIKDRYFGTHDPVASKMLNQEKIRKEELAKEKEAAARAQAQQFDPSKIAPPPGVAPSSEALSVLYPSMDKNWMGERASANET
eukprot:TRINITY_DN4200_c0_g1_i1.p1 TRINITY_DN4200_c0_g1~~TRINITY_DN4200_c0_g1_i1.p1  ORF type:complete len:284 (+),score=35.10 TRINITY_DN4200_c0_g1_i1:62-913(+)